MNDFNYENCFNPYIKSFNKITLDKEHSEKVKSTILRLMNEKQRSLKRSLTDKEKESFKRNYMQIAGEAALEQFLDIDFVDYKTAGNHKKPFINKLLNDKGQVDTCTFSHGYFPLVYPRTYRKTIFICMVTKNEFYICGVGEPNIINGYTKQSLVQNEYLRSLGKTAFFGFDHLKPMPSDLGKFLNFFK